MRRVGDASLDPSGTPPVPPRQPPPLVVRDADGAWTAEFRALRRAMGMP